MNFLGIFVRRVLVYTVIPAKASGLAARQAGILDPHFRGDDALHASLILKDNI